MKKVTVLLLLIIMLPIRIFAKDCTDGELASLKKYASHLNYSYEYYFDDNNIYFDVTIVNLFNDIYVVDTTTGKQYKSFENILKRKENGQSLKFEVYSKTCGELLTTKIVNLPKYNKYYKSEQCSDISEFKYCSKWGNYDLNQDEFKKAVIEYKTQFENIKIEPPITYKTKIMGFYVFIFLILLTLIMILVSIYKKDRGKDII